MTALAPEAARRPSQHLDAENPWPGLWPFTEDSEAYFNGRSAETAELARLVRRETLTLLYGQSGLGKSSLLMAGLFPLVRREDFLPVYIRLDHAPGSASFGDQVLHRLERECRQQRVDVPERPDGCGLWEYLHRVDARFWSRKNRLVTPLFVIDQFEELFTVGSESRVKQRQVQAELAQLVDNRPPDALLARLAEDRALLDVYDLEASRYKVVLGMREDYLASLDELKREMRLNMHNALRLTPMDGEQALDAVRRTGGALVEDGAAEAIVRFLARGPTGAEGEGRRELREGQVDPALLSMVCYELNEKRRALGQPRITADLLERKRPQEILAGFYERSFDGLLDGAPRLRVFVEERLLTESGYRSSDALDDAQRREGVTVAGIEELVRRRLLRSDVRSRVQRVELTHDVLTDVVKESRDRRRLAEKEAASRRELRAREEAARVAAAAALAGQEAARREAASAQRRARRARLFAAGAIALAILAGGSAFLAVRAARTTRALLHESQARRDSLMYSQALERSATENARRQAERAEAGEKEARRSDSTARAALANVSLIRLALLDTVTRLRETEEAATAQKELADNLVRRSGQIVRRQAALVSQNETSASLIAASGDSIMKAAGRVSEQATARADTALKRLVAFQSAYRTILCPLAAAPGDTARSNILVRFDRAVEPTLKGASALVGPKACQ
jgi:hypothetical protein